MKLYNILFACGTVALMSACGSSKISAPATATKDDAHVTCMSDAKKQKMSDAEASSTCGSSHVSKLCYTDTMSLTRNNIEKSVLACKNVDSACYNAKLKAGLDKHIPLYTVSAIAARACVKASPLVEKTKKHFSVAELTTVDQRCVSDAKKSVKLEASAIQRACSGIDSTCYDASIKESMAFGDILSTAVGTAVEKCKKVNEI